MTVPVAPQSTVPVRVIENAWPAARVIPLVNWPDSPSTAPNPALDERSSPSPLPSDPAVRDEKLTAAGSVSLSVNPLSAALVAGFRTETR